MALSDQSKNYLKIAVGSPDACDEIVEKLDQVCHVDFDLTSGQMDALNATPISVISAPGSGYMLEYLGADVFVDAGATAFELGSGVLNFRYENSSGGIAGQISNAAVESASDIYYNAVPLACLMLVNKAIVIHASADVTAGDGSIHGRVYYRITKVANFNS